jgi:tRNA-dihydrouridine synthase
MIVIGSLKIKNNVILAPMAGISDLPFRMMAREAGCALAFTEMISANGLVRGIEKSQQYMKSCIDDKPLGVQIFGNDPTTMADAVRIVDD